MLQVTAPALLVGVDGRGSGGGVTGKGTGGISGGKVVGSGGEEKKVAEVVDILPSLKRK
jgi:hypothetical protein